MRSLLERPVSFRLSDAAYRRYESAAAELHWIAGRPQPLARDVTLPPALRANVNTTLLFENSAADLKTLADRIQITTGILTHVSADALLPAEYFLPRLAVDQGVATASANFAAATADTLVPALVPGIAVDRIAGPVLPQGVARTKMAPLPPGQAPLATVLDSIALRLGVYWRYDEKIGALRFYRTETKSYVVRTAIRISTVGGPGRLVPKLRDHRVACALRGRNPFFSLARAQQLMFQKFQRLCHRVVVGLDD